MVVGLDDRDVADSVRETPWLPGRLDRERARRQKQTLVRLAVQGDPSVFPDEIATAEVNDVPVSFDPEYRQYQSRLVVNTSVRIPTGVAEMESLPVHDPMAALGGAL